MPAPHHSRGEGLWEGRRQAGGAPQTPGVPPPTAPEAIFPPLNPASAPGWLCDPQVGAFFPLGLLAPLLSQGMAFLIPFQWHQLAKTPPPAPGSLCPPHGSSCFPCSCFLPSYPSPPSLPPPFPLSPPPFLSLSPFPLPPLPTPPAVPFLSHQLDGLWQDAQRAGQGTQLENRVSGAARNPNAAALLLPLPTPPAAPPPPRPAGPSCFPKRGQTPHPTHHAPPAHQQNCKLRKRHWAGCPEPCFLDPYLCLSLPLCKVRLHVGALRA